MQSTIKWMRQKDDDRNPIVEVKDNEYCGECRKHLIFRLGGEVVEVHTDEDGLKKIADAIADHPKQMQRKAEAKVKEAIAEARRGIGRGGTVRITSKDNRASIKKD